MKREIFDHPAVYRISIWGFLGEDWSDRLGNMAITNSQPAEGTVETTLYGQLTDQSALLGVLNTLYEMGFSLLLVERLSGD
jgi:hypothetical protein